MDQMLCILLLATAGTQNTIPEGPKTVFLGVA